MRRAETKWVAAWAFAGFSVVTMIGAFLIVAVLASATSDRIQSERARNIRQSCEQQNSRHDNTIQQLDALIARLPKDRQARARENRDGTVLLIDALAPKRDCADVVRTQVTP